ncbi:hypothetical protein EYF80_008832 [Liparis tanakae]|uniref:Uncharacterized protein n=1 Tax=Liparis tanakae TaxID=230148 RepID=A0A4Z2IST0_9TELE|nr:hypothetical protein EYF80_008832 [Liparis tanakae]
MLPQLEEVVSFSSGEKSAASSHVASLLHSQPVVCSQREAPGYTVPPDPTGDAPSTTHASSRTGGRWSAITDTTTQLDQQNRIKVPTQTFWTTTTDKQHKRDKTYGHQAQVLLRAAGCLIRINDEEAGSEESKEGASRGHCRNDTHTANCLHHSSKGRSNQNLADMTCPMKSV